MAHRLGDGVLGRLASPARRPNDRLEPETPSGDRLLVGRNPRREFRPLAAQAHLPSSAVQTTHRTGVELQRVPVGGQTFRNRGDVVTRADVATEQIQF